MTRLLAVLLALALCASAFAAPRDAAVRYEFRKAHPCPSTGKRTGRCPGYQIDHTVAIMNGGADTVANMQWLANDAHRAKTREDFLVCKRSTECAHRAIKRKRDRERALSDTRSAQ